MENSIVNRDSSRDVNLRFVFQIRIINFHVLYLSSLEVVDSKGDDLSRALTRDHKLMQIESSLRD